MAATPRSDDELLDAYYSRELPPGFVRSKHRARLAGREAPERTGGFAPVTPTRTKQLIDRMMTGMAPLLAECSVPIYVPDDGQPVQHGTGTLCQIADLTFIVTAAHVFDAWAVGGRTLYSGAAVPGSTLVPLSGQVNGHVEADVAVFALTDETTAALAGYRPLSLSRADRRGRPPEEGWYLVYGFPRCFTDSDSDQRHVSAGPYMHGSTLYRGRTTHLQDAETLNSDVHLLLMADGLHIDSNGDLTTLPRLNGISGGSMWQTFRPGQRPDAWTPEYAEVVGVQTHVYPKTGIIRGTRWWVVEEIIRRNWPHLAPALSLEVPDPSQPAAV